MKHGKFEKNFDWLSYHNYNFNIFGPEWDEKYTKGSCGTYALSCLTGLSPKFVSKQLTSGDCWSDKQALKFLHDRGFETKELTIGLLTSHTKEQKSRFSRYHVVLVSQDVCREEGTWAVCWNNYQYHSGEVDQMSPYEFLKYPVMSAYLVRHPKWTLSSKHKETKIALDIALDRVESIMSEYKNLVTPGQKKRKAKQFAQVMSKYGL